MTTINEWRDELSAEWMAHAESLTANRRKWNPLDWPAFYMGRKCKKLADSVAAMNFTPPLRDLNGAKAEIQQYMDEQRNEQWREQS